MRLDVREVPREDTQGVIANAEGVLSQVLKSVQSGEWNIQELNFSPLFKTKGADEHGFAIKELTPFRVVTMIIEVMPKEGK